MTDQSQLSRGGRGAHRRRIDQREAHASRPASETPGPSSARCRPACRRRGMPPCPVAVIVWPPRRRAAAGRQAGGGRAVGDRQHARRALGRHRRSHHRRMDVKAVADDLGRDFLGLKDGAGQPGRAVAEGRHAIEQMCRLTRAGRDRRERLVVGRRRMAERHAVAARRQPSDQVDPAVELRRERDDADVGCGALDLAKDIAAGRSPRFGCAPSPRTPVRPAGPPERRSRRPQAAGGLRAAISGLMKLLSR